jgi:hypothetical protein
MLSIHDINEWNMSYIWTNLAQFSLISYKMLSLYCRLLFGM